MAMRGKVLIAMGLVFAAPLLGAQEPRVTQRDVDEDRAHPQCYAVICKSTPGQFRMSEARNWRAFFAADAR